MADDVVSAQVVLATFANAGEVPTAANISRLAPKPAAAAEIRQWFSQHGFDIGPYVGVSFSITAPRQTFVTELGVDPADAAGDGNLPFDRLAIRHLAAQIEAVTVSRPPAFGPGNP
jgi:hypothetical protein